MTEGNEDETRIADKTDGCREGDQGHPPCDAQAIFGRRKIRIVLDGLRGEEITAELCRREGISQSIYYKWSKEFPEAGKRRLAGDTARAASTGEVKDLRRKTRDLKEVVAEQTLELRLLKKSMTVDGKTTNRDTLHLKSLRSSATKSSGIPPNSSLR